jgi:hypothetical protein
MMDEKELSIDRVKDDGKRKRFDLFRVQIDAESRPQERSIVLLVPSDEVCSTVRGVSGRFDDEIRSETTRPRIQPRQNCSEK